MGEFKGGNRRLNFSVSPTSTVPSMPHAEPVACSSPPCQAAVSAASVGTVATGSAGVMRWDGRRGRCGEIKAVYRP